MKRACPSCGNKSDQKDVGKVERKDSTGRPAPTLYRCNACGHLYTVPKLPEAR
ncbi:MAG TPA: hypothetical protein VFI31_15175 [Pirellulales bacterium]|nr:hypothetical protein [Pirellulales bacterium]